MLKLRLEELHSKKRSGEQGLGSEDQDPSIYIETVSPPI
jgi:hypothetical protein